MSPNPEDPNPTPLADAPTETAGEAESGDADLDEDLHGPGRFARFTKRILEREDGRNVLSAMWETSDRARMEMVRIMGREVRNYLDALELKDSVMDLVESHSLEVHATFRLRANDDTHGAVESAGEGKDDDGDGVR